MHIEDAVVIGKMTSNYKTKTSLKSDNGFLMPEKITVPVLGEFAL